jgi:hypothetical protein
MQVFLLSQFTLGSEPAWRHKDGINKEHGERITMFLISKHNLYDLTLILPNFTKLVIHFLRSYVPLLAFFRFFIRQGWMGC